MAIRDELTPAQLAEAEEYLKQMQSLAQHDGFKIVTSWLDGQLEMTAQLVETTNDPTALARSVGKLAALRDLRSRVDREIDHYVKLLKGEL